MISLKKHTLFTQGCIDAAFIASSIKKHSVKTSIGAHDIFLGQVRNDVICGKKVQAIVYSAYEEMAEEMMNDIREAAFEKFKPVCLHIYHSLGKVNAGEICLFVFVSAQHRESAFEACRWIVEEIKKNLPIWGKEIFEDETFTWKQNK